MGCTRSAQPLGSGLSAGFDAPSIALASDGKPQATEVSANSEAMHPDGSGYIDAAFSQQISFVKIVDLSVRECSCHVYNLETVDGWYLAEGLIVSNCECVCVPIVETESGEEEENEGD